MVEGAGGPSWYTEYNVLTGLSVRSYGRFADFVTRMSNPTVVDVAVAYTAAAAGDRSDADMAAYVRQLVADANRPYANSNTNVNRNVNVNQNVNVNRDVNVNGNRNYYGGGYGGPCCYNSGIGTAAAIAMISAEPAPNIGPSRMYRRSP